MLSTIIEAEHALDALLPPGRLEQSPSTQLLEAASAWSQAIWAEAEQQGPLSLSDEQLRQGLRLAQNPVFICGVHRSGTTLVKDILDGHPDLVVLPSEGTYYTNLESKLQGLPGNKRMAFLGKEWLRRLANPINQPPYWLLGRSTNICSPYIDFARYLMSWWVVVDRKNTQWSHTAIILAYASCTGGLSAKLWVDKTPANERFLNRIWQEMPNAKILHIIREPVATLSSRKKMEPNFNIRHVLRDLKTSFSVAIEQSTSDSRFMLVCYEELCENPQTIGERLASFLGIEISASLSKPTVAGLPAQANSSFNPQAAPGHILKPAQHKQNEVLTLDERRLLSAYMGNLIVKLNYPAIHVGFLYKIYLRLKNRLW